MSLDLEDMGDAGCLGSSRKGVANDKPQLASSDLAFEEVGVT